MLTVPEAARRARRDPETIRRWIRAGKLTARKVGTQHVIHEDDLAALLGVPSRTRQGAGIHEAATPYGSPSPETSAAPALDLWLPQVVGRLRHALDPVRIVLYGARARGEQRPDSDFELLVIL